MTSPDLLAFDATAQAEMVRSGAVSARELLEATLRRIESLDGDINAYRVVMAESAVAAAERIDGMTEVERSSLPLAGVPIAIKDDTDVEGQVTAWGSRVDRGTSERDSDVVARLRAAGAVVIGKTNVPELTLWPWTASERWGVTRNPWDPDRTPGGSSGGSAAAVCTGMAAMAARRLPGNGSDPVATEGEHVGMARALERHRPAGHRCPDRDRRTRASHRCPACGPLRRRSDAARPRQGD